MANLPAPLQRLVNEGYEFHFGDYIGKGFNLVQRYLGGYIGYYLLFFAICLGSVLIPIIGALALMVIAPALMIGPAIVANKLDRNESVQFNDFFGGFNRFGELFLVALLTGLIVIALAIPGYGLVIYSMFSNMGSMMGVDQSDPMAGFSVMAMFLSDPMFLLGMLLAIVPATYVAVSFVWAPYLVWFHRMSAWDAMMASRKVIGKNWWTMLGFVIVIGLIGGLGLLLLGVGILFTYPAMHCSQYAAFADVTKLNESPAGDVDVIDHFNPPVA